MDIYCPICGEPWDSDELHDAGMTYENARAAFSTEGCAVFKTQHGAVDAETAMKSAVLFDALGDDIDAIASIM